MSGLAHDENGGLVQTEGFDYAAVDRNIFDHEEAQEIAGEVTDEDIQAAVRILCVLIRWIWQDGMKNEQGLQIRSAIICWIFLKELRPMNLTQFAGGFGMDKQSMGRWVDQFKLDFPNIRTPHMRG